MVTGEAKTRLLGYVAVPPHVYAAPSPHVAPVLAAVCCYFNPQRYQSRLANFAAFHRNHLARTPGTPLWVVELAVGDAPFELTGVPNLIQVRGRDVLWQKERLLNLGIAHVLALGYRQVAWLDADVLLPDPYWPERAAQELERVPLCQLFSESVREEDAGYARPARPGVVRGFAQTGRMVLNGRSCGYAWAARSELLEAFPLFDVCVLGGGDAAIWLGAQSTLPQWREALERTSFFQSLGPGLKAHYLAWAARYGAEVRGRIGYLPQTAFSLGHGKIVNRRYASRYLRIPQFDPLADLQREQSGCWRWRDAATPLAAPVRDYFEGRQEDERAVGDDVSERFRALFLKATGGAKQGWRTA